MARPTVSSTAEEAFERMVPWNDADQYNDWALLKFLEALTTHLHTINTLVRDTDERPGWSSVMDLDTVPAQYLPWLAQFVGVTLDMSLSEADQRKQIRDTQGFRRGTPAAIQAAAKLYLTGTKTVILDERDTSAYHLRVRTFAAETPDPDRVLAALLSEKPAGLVLDYQVTEGLTYNEIAASGKTYDELDAQFASSNAMKQAQTV